MHTRPLYLSEKPRRIISAYAGASLRCKTWEAEAALRMLENNLDPKVALVPDELIVYGGAGRAARNWREFNTIAKTLKHLAPDETMLVQSGKAVGVIKTFTHAPRVLIANSNIVPAWSTQENFDQYDQMGLTMYGQMTAGSWIYIATQGILQGTYETFAAIADKHFKDSLKGRLVVTGGLGGMSGAQPLAVTMNGGICLVVEAIKSRVAQKFKERYIDAMTEDFAQAVSHVNSARKTKKPFSIGLVGNTATILPALLKAGIVPDIVTDQTSAHDLLSYWPEGNVSDLIKLKEQNPKEFRARALAAIVKHTKAILEMQRRGAIAFDYGNNLRGQAEAGGLCVRDKSGQFLYPGFVPAYIRPLFCEGKGPFRWAALSGDAKDIWRLDSEILKMFRGNESLKRWINLAQTRVPFIGLPARVCWLGYGDRARFGLKVNELVRSGAIKAPIVIGRDHLDCGSVASPNRETENMKDGSDAIADWPFLNAMSNVACGADWVSIHNGGGVGIGKSTHAGVVIVATGTKEKDERLERVLTADPGLGVMRHADAGYEIAIKTAQKKGIKIPSLK